MAELPPTSSQSQGSGGPPATGDAVPPTVPPVFPEASSQQVVQPEAQQAQTVHPSGSVQPNTPLHTQGSSPPGLQPIVPNAQTSGPLLYTPKTPTSNLIRPIPGTINRSPEDVTRDIGWIALTEAITQAAVGLYPNDPQAVAATVANALQPYMQSFGRGPPINPSTQGSPQQGQPLSKTTESIILGAVTGRKSQEVGKYQHTFPSFPGDACRDDVDLWEKYWESVFGFQKVSKMRG